jgi:hypothetical protein
MDRPIDRLPIPSGIWQIRVASPERPWKLAAFHALGEFGFLHLEIAANLVARQQARGAPGGRPGDDAALHSGHRIGYCIVSAH